MVAFGLSLSPDESNFSTFKSRACHYSALKSLPLLLCSRLPRTSARSTRRRVCSSSWGFSAPRRPRSRRRLEGCLRACARRGSRCAAAAFSLRELSNGFPTNGSKLAAARARQSLPSALHPINICFGRRALALRDTVTLLCPVCVRFSTAACTVQVGTALVTPALPAILRWLLPGRPAQQDVAAEILSNAAEPAVLSAVAATQGAIDALAEMLQGRWESRYWAAACLAQLACCPATDTAVPEARSVINHLTAVPPDPTIKDQRWPQQCYGRTYSILIKRRDKDLHQAGHHSRLLTSPRSA